MNVKIRNCLGDYLIAQLLLVTVGLVLLRQAVEHLFFCYSLDVSLPLGWSRESV